MRRLSEWAILLEWVILLGALTAAGAAAQAIHGRGGITLPPPPAVQAIPVTDTYFGTKIVDNYRWLEDGSSPQTQSFIDAENAYTQRYLDHAPIHPQISEDLLGLEQVASWSPPIQRGNDLFFLKRLAGEDQAAIYLRHGSKQPPSASQASNNPTSANQASPNKDQRLVDPAQFSRDPNTSVHLADVSPDGSLVAYEVRQGGADETTVRVYSVQTGKPLFDELPSARYWSITFTPDGAGLYYTRATPQGTLLYLHKLGTRPSNDTLLFGREFRGEELGPNDLITASVTDDGHYLVATIERGVPARRVDIVYRDLTKPQSYFEILVWGMDARFAATYARGAWYVRTDYHAPNGCILLAYPGILPDVWKTIVPEQPQAIQDFSIVGGKLYVTRLKDVQPETAVYTLEGKPAGTLPSNGLGAVSALRGRTTDRYGFFRFESVIQPPVIYQLDTTTGKRTVFAQPRIPFDPSQFELKQVFCISKDGAKIPLFIAGKKGLKLDGSARLLMTGYGGFNVDELPRWNPLDAWWLQQGGWFAMPSLRGGGEYGERWHQAGMLEKKQNVFDDFFAAANYLIAHQYTSPAHLAIMGQSNGGLLMGAAIVQHPELFSAVLCAYPLLDMLRYQRFLQGSHWITEYGSSSDEKQFAYLRKHSPYQNVKPDIAYPAVMFFTGANDTRVDPLHARKMTALLQANSTSGRPILLRWSKAGGHSAGLGVEQQIRDHADQLAFLWTETEDSATAK